MSAGHKPARSARSLPVLAPCQIPVLPALSPRTRLPSLAYAGKAAPGSGTAGCAVPASLRGIGAQAASALGLLTGLWVALSPWFITLQYGGSNATAVDLISALAVAAVSAFALASPRRFSGLQLGSLLLGIWLIISPPIPGPQAPHRPRDVLVQQLLRRGADRPGGGRPRLRSPAPDRPLTAQGWGPEGQGPRPGRATPSRRALTPAAETAAQEHVMSLRHHHQNQLHLIQVGLLRSDPPLAARLSMFGRLSAGQAVPAWEQVPSRHDRIRQAAALIAETISVAAAAIFLFLRAVLALVTAVAQGGRARPLAQRRQRARPRPGSGRPAGADGRG